MSYGASENSVEGSQPAELYEFVGTFKTYRYTSGDQDVTVDGHVFTAIPMERTSLKALVYNDDVSKMEIKVPATTQLVIDYGYQSTPPRLDLTIRRYHRTDNPASSYLIIWSGSLTSCSISEDIATLVVPDSFSYALDCVIPTICYQSPCSHTLYDTGCGILRDTNKCITSVDGIDERLITVHALGSFTVDEYIGGELRNTVTGESRMVVDASGMGLTVTYPFSQLDIDDQIEIVRGCDHAFLGHCHTRYHNQKRFGGDPYIPGMNPFVTGI
jgi:hypothetical protein